MILARGWTFSVLLNSQTYSWHWWNSKCKLEFGGQILSGLLKWYFFVDLDYCDIEWFDLEMNRDHSVIFEIGSKYCISDPFVDHGGHSISSEGFLPAVVDIMVIWVLEYRIKIPEVQEGMMAICPGSKDLNHKKEWWLLALKKESHIEPILPEESWDIKYSVCSENKVCN